MKAEFDKEMDSLLRERARRVRAASGRTGDAGSGAPHAAHLDADEQSAYAENALPAAARAHYTAHLADCDDCRRSVTQLALAAGTAAQLEPRETARTISSQTGWRERLGALLSPRAWRYAVPALALLLVGVVSVVVLTRRTERVTSIARREATETQRNGAAKSNGATQTEAHHAPNDNAAPVDGATQNETVASPGADASVEKPNSPLSREEITANHDREGAAQSPPGVGGGQAAPPPPVAAVSGGGAGGTGARAVSVSPTPAPVVSDGVTSASDRDDYIRRGEPVSEQSRVEQKLGSVENRQREQVSNSRRNEQARSARTAEADSARAGQQSGDMAAAPAAPLPTPPPPPAAAATTARSARRSAQDRAGDEDSAAGAAERSETGRAKSVAEMRGVAGRRFRRQGDAWIDTAYRAGQSYTTVRRNSEQFRALVADEPELRRIADALGGEVTVVWKGRAYRIR
ncbi:MAG TPA: hypothetical protein VEY11_12215 [Pyrinomonadaceae bacterium]|nr:hypothetical protein [Pyrinomonadaceae bacterium]